MAELVEQSSPNCCLLDLPDALIDHILSSLTSADKINLMAVCRKAAQIAALAFNKATLRITQDTRFTGIRQVLNWFPLETHLELFSPPDQEGSDQPVYDRPFSALQFFMRMVTSDYASQVAATCHWEAITKVTIQGTQLRCLVPPFLALACPNLAQLKLIQPDTDTKDAFTSKVPDALPMVQCSSLKQLHLDFVVKESGIRCPTTQLPPAYHTVAELQRNLPNVDILTMKTSYSALIEAFSAQLTRLEIEKHSLAVDKALRQCSRLEHLSVTAFALPTNTATLRVLELKSCLCSDNSFKQLLQLPNLTTLKLANSEPYTYMLVPPSKQDWGTYTCSWHELHLDDMRYIATLKNLSLSSLKVLSTGTDVDFAAIAKLNLTSLKEWRLGPDVEFRFPDPRDHDCLTAVRKAVDDLSQCGKLMLDETPNSDVFFGKRGTMTLCLGWHGYEFEQTAAEMVSIAAQRIGPAKICNCQYILHQPLVLSAVFNWGCTFIESVCWGNADERLPQDAWQALQQLCNLNTVVLWDDGYIPIYSNEESTGTMTGILCNAAQHYVIPANRKLRMEFGLSNFYDDQAEVELIHTTFRTTTQDVLPAGCQLVSFDLCPMESVGHCYGDKCYADAFWVVTLAPV